MVQQQVHPQHQVTSQQPVQRHMQTHQPQQIPNQSQVQPPQQLIQLHTHQPQQVTTQAQPQQSHQLVQQQVQHLQVQPSQIHQQPVQTQSMHQQQQPPPYQQPHYQHYQSPPYQQAPTPQPYGSPNYQYAPNEYLSPPPPPPPPPQQQQPPQQSPYYDPYYQQVNTPGYTSPLTSRPPSSGQPGSQESSGPPTPNHQIGSPSYSDYPNYPQESSNYNYNNYPQQQQQQQPQQQQQQQQKTYQSFPSTPTTDKKSNYVPPGDEFVRGPEPGMKGPYSVKCTLCGNLSKTKSDFYRHLSEKHYKSELLRELPSGPPYACTICPYESKDKSFNPLIRHFGVAHKMVQKYIGNRIAGVFVPSERKQSSSTNMNNHPTNNNHNPPPPPSSSAVVVTPTPELTLSTQSTIKVKCPFCDVMFVARYMFHQHLCDLHFKDQLAAQLPPHPAGSPNKCPINGCPYVARDNHLSLVRHYGMTHKFVLELLKQHAPEYADENYDPFNNQQYNLHHHQPPQVFQQPQYQQYNNETSSNSLPSISEFFGNTSTSTSSSTTTTQYGDMQIDGTFDHTNDHSLDGLRTISSLSNASSTPVKENLLLGLTPEIPPSTPPPPPPPVTNPPLSKTCNSSSPSPSSKTATIKICELCGKTFDGKNRSMLKTQHLVFHFREKLYNDLKDNSAPFTCPFEGCLYKTKHKPDWARHYGSVHKFLDKYLEEKLAEEGLTIEEATANQIAKLDPPTAAAAAPTPPPPSTPVPSTPPDFCGSSGSFDSSGHRGSPYSDSCSGGSSSFTIKIG